MLRGGAWLLLRAATQCSEDALESFEEVCSRHRVTEKNLEMLKSKRSSASTLMFSLMGDT